MRQLYISSALPGFEVGEFAGELIDKFISQGLHGRNVDDAHIRVILYSVHGSQHGHSGDVGLTGTCRGADQHVVHTFVSLLENDALDFVEVFALETWSVLSRHVIGYLYEVCL